MGYGSSLMAYHTVKLRENLVEVNAGIMKIILQEEMKERKEISWCAKRKKLQVALKIRVTNRGEEN